MHQKMKHVEYRGTSSLLKNEIVSPPLCSSVYFCSEVLVWTSEVCDIIVIDTVTHQTK